MCELILSHLLKPWFNQIKLSYFVRRSITVKLTSSFICLDLAALQMLN